MTHDELERAMEFVLAQQAKLTGAVATLTADVAELKVTVRDVIEEMREGFNNLIVSNEVTRDLATKIGELAVNNSRRSTRVERQLQLE